MIFLASEWCEQIAVLIVFSYLLSKSAYVVFRIITKMFNFLQNEYIFIN